MELLSRILRAAQGRIIWSLFLTYLGLLFAVASSALLLAGLVNLAVNHSPFRLEFVWFALGAALIAALFLVWRHHPSLIRTAHILDRRGQTKDRYYTAYLFFHEPSREPMEEAAIAECSRFIEQKDWKPLIPVRFPRTVVVALAPLAALALLQWHFLLHHQPAPIDPILQAVVSEQAKKLDQLAKQIEEARFQQQSTQLEQLVKELRNTAQRITQERPSSEEVRKAALREFSSLEALLEEMMRSANLETSPEELKALAEALKQVNQEEAAKQLEEGKFEEAARQLEELMKKLQQSQDPEQTRRELAESMREAVDRLSEDQKKQVAQQMQQLAETAAAMRDPEIQQALQKLKQLMQELAKSQQNQQAESKKQQQQQQGNQQNQKEGSSSREMPLTAEALKQLIEALENMKRQLQNGEMPQDGGEQMMSLQMPGDGGQPGMSGMADSNGPASGQPGSEMDFGTTETPFGSEQPAKPGPEGPAKRLAGMLGEGESLREFIGAAGDESKAKQRYKEIYQAMAAEAQDSVNQETIPLGSRLLIRRYFESIRPKE